MNGFNTILNQIPTDIFSNLEYLHGILDGHYEQMWRLYHNYNHISSMLSTLDDWYTDKENLFPYQDFVVAILFHDIVYDLSPQQPGQNERDSFNTFYKHRPKFLRPNKYVVNSENVHALILATTHDWSFVNHYTDPIEIESMKLMIDLDLETFAWEWNEFKKVDQNIVAEYESRFKPDEVRFGRTQFLKSFVKRKNIFQLGHVTQRDTEHGAEVVEWDVIAKENINRLLKEEYGE